MLNCFGVIAPVIARACHIIISRKIDTFWKATIGLSLIDPDIVILQIPVIFFPSLSNQWNIRGSFLCISAVSGAVVWQRCRFKVNDEIFRYFMPQLHFPNFTLKVKFDLINQRRSYRNFSSSRIFLKICQIDIASGVTSLY